MMTEPKSGKRRVRPRRLPFRLYGILESGALYPGESEEAFSDFRKEIAEALGGQEDFIDRMLISDIAEHAWEVLRLRKFKATFLLRHIVQKIYDLLLSHKVPAEAAWDVVEIYGNGQFARLHEIEACLVKLHCTYAALEAEVVMEKMSALREYDGSIERAEERRDSHLRELERRHGVRRSRPRDEVVDLAADEFVAVETDVTPK